MGYYDPLRDYLMDCDSDEVTLTFAQVEAILGRALPASAWKYDAWWANLGDDASTTLLRETLAPLAEGGEL